MSICLEGNSVSKIHTPDNYVLQGLAKVVCKASDNKYFRAYSLWEFLSSGVGARKKPDTTFKCRLWLCSDKTL